MAGKVEVIEPGIQGEFHKNPGWIIKDGNGNPVTAIDTGENIAEYTARRIKELKKAGKKIPWYPER